MPRTLVAAPDKFKGTATAAQVANAICRAGIDAGWICDPAPIADGGDGTLDVFGGQRRKTTVTGPLGSPVDAEWVLRGDTAIVEAALTSGLVLAGSAEGNDPMAASSAGVGELVVAATKAGAERVLVGAGGVASTDGGLGAIEAMRPHSRLGGIEIEVLVGTLVAFIDAARMYGPQKGANATQVELLERRLNVLADKYLSEFGVDVRDVPGAGAAGGLGGGLVAVGATIRSGFGALAEEIELDERVARADLVVTGEGRVDEQSFTGKVLSGVIEIARRHEVGVLVVAGSADPHVVSGLRSEGVEVSVLSSEFGPEASMTDPVGCTYRVLRSRLAR